MCYHLSSASLQFLAAHPATSGPPMAVVAWADLTKMGRLGEQGLELCCHRGPPGSVQAAIEINCFDPGAAPRIRKSEQWPARGDQVPWPNISFSSFVSGSA